MQLVQDETLFWKRETDIKENPIPMVIGMGEMLFS